MPLDLYKKKLLNIVKSYNIDWQGDLCWLRVLVFAIFVNGTYNYKEVKI